MDEKRENVFGHQTYGATLLKQSAAILKFRPLWHREGTQNTGEGNQVAKRAPIERKPNGEKTHLLTVDGTLAVDDHSGQNQVARKTPVDQK